MQTVLHEMKCAPCEGGVPPLSEAEARKLQSEVPAWTLRENAKEISRTFKFKDFKETMIFVNAVAELAEAEGHHPDILVTWNKVTLTLSTHAIGGLSSNDFILAAKVDRVMS